MLKKLPMVDDQAQYAEALEMASAARPGCGPTRPPMEALPGGRLEDRFGRRVSYLRVSVTDRCNLKCEYCVPVTQQQFMPRQDLLTDDEIVAILSALAERGLEKVRFTGGEPLVRPGFTELVRRCRAIPGLRKLCVTTNGVLLEAMGAELMEAGVDHFNVSVDTLDATRFRDVTRGGDLARVWRGIDHVLALGTRTLKLNVVLMKGLNDADIEAFCRIGRERPIEVRFIELMPLSHCGEIHDDWYLPADRVRAVLERLGAAPLGQGDRTDGPAVRYRVPGAQAPVGLIAPVSETHFCDSCNRVRLSADGKLKLCLFGDAHVDLRAVLRSGPEHAAALEHALLDAMNLKPEKMAGYSGFTMMAIGG